MSGHSGGRRLITVRGTVLLLFVALLLYGIIKVPDTTYDGLKNLGDGATYVADGFWTFLGKFDGDG